MFEATFVPELAIGMVSLPRTVLLLFIVEAARRPWFASLVEPFPPTNNLSVLETARRLHLAVIEEVPPLSRLLPVVELTLTRDKAVLEEELKGAIFGIAVFIDPWNIFHCVALLVELTVGVERKCSA